MKGYGWICSCIGSIALSLLLTVELPDWLFASFVSSVWLSAAGTLSAVLEARL